MKRPYLIRLEGIYGVAVFERIGAAIARAAYHRGGITLVTSTRAPSGPQGWATADYDGVITTGNHLSGERKLRVNKPVILISARHTTAPLPRVISDDHAIGALAAQHLISAGAVELIALDWVDLGYVRRRFDGFLETAKAAHIPCKLVDWKAAFEASGQRGSLAFSQAMREQVKRLFRNLPKQAGIFVSADDRAATLWHEAERMGWRAPQDFLIIGVDDLEGWNLLPIKGLSSVVPDCERIGQVALDRVLNSLMEGKLPEGDFLIPPLGVAIRRSTDRAAAVEDPLVAEAVRRIRSGEHLGDKGEALAAALGVSRSTLYRRFRSALGQTPYAYIEQARLEIARRLLRTTALTAAEIAFRCGYQNASAFGRAFRRAEGVPPHRWRFKHQSLAATP